MMVARTAKFYRSKAQRARNRAALTSDLRVRDVWLAMARQFDHLAAVAERHGQRPLRPGRNKTG
jgi:hypothetical protein